MGGTSCERLERDVDLPEAEDPQGGVSIMMAFLGKTTLVGLG
jgi:hypothetical protein